MNFDLENLFGGGIAKLSALENCENSWKKLIKNPNQEEFWGAAISAYDLLLPCKDEDALPKELIGIYTVLHDFAENKFINEKEPIMAAIAEAISGIAAYSIVDIPIENARSVRAFTLDDEYIINFDKKEVIKQ